MKRFPPKRLLVAADMSASALAALDAAKMLALQWDAALEIVHVEAPPLPPIWGPYGALPPGRGEAASDERPALAAKLRAAAAGFPPERVKFRTVRGWPAASLLELARPERADLMVMGTHGYSGLDRLLTGSVSEAVIRRARIPVLAVPETADAAGIARVLAPWNGRPYATRALRWARDLARGLCATLDVLHVSEPGMASVETWASLDARMLALLGPGADWSLRARKGDSRRRIIEEANSGRYGLVVLSAHRRRFGADFALGSTIERLLRHSEIPVLAVPSGVMRRPLVRRLASRVGGRIY
ncbi:MAG: universal stress protein [Elusimicrobiota bacterium]